MNRGAEGWLELCAETERRYAALTLEALGHALHHDGSMWWSTAAVPAVLVQAGSLRPHSLDAALRVLSTLPGPALFRDTFAALDLSPHGFEADTGETWMARPAAPIDPPAVAGLSVVRATTPDAVALFERTAFANAGDLRSYVPGSVHPASATATLDGLHLLVGFVDGVPVATAIAVEGADVVGVQTVTTDPAFRRRGIGAAMVARCCSVGPDRPAALSATPAAVGVYRSLGFEPLGPAPQWSRPEPADRGRS